MYSIALQALADKKKDVMDEDILALVSDEVHQPEKLWDVLDLQVTPSPVLHAVCLEDMPAGLPTYLPGFAVDLQDITCILAWLQNRAHRCTSKSVAETCTSTASSL